MSYTRVIPRDLFNEASLLKCLGRLYIETERFDVVELEHDGDAFETDQNEDDGSITCRNVTLTIHGELYALVRPLNSRAPWPLYLETANDDRIDVFGDDGELGDDFLNLIRGEVA